MKPQEVLSHFETQVNIAKKLRIKQPSVANWFVTGKVPLLRQYQIERVTGGKLKVSEQ